MERGRQEGTKKIKIRFFYLLRKDGMSFNNLKRKSAKERVRERINLNLFSESEIM